MHTLKTGDGAAHGASAPSPWITRWSHLLAPGCTVLDVACGGGRHLHWFASRGHPVVGVDRDIAAAKANVPAAQLVQADIENGPWPLTGCAGAEGSHGSSGSGDSTGPASTAIAQPFGAVVVTNYLWRPLLPTLLQSLAPGGLLLYETFAAGNETVGRPARADFLLQPGELLRVCSDLQVVAYENGFIDQPERFVQRIAAFAAPLPNLGGTPISRHPL